MSDKIILYTSNYCSHAKSVQAWMEQEAVSAEIRNISEEFDFRDEVEAINNGNASVPTLVFPDGSTMTEPSIKQLRAKLGMPAPGLLSRLRGLLE